MASVPVDEHMMVAVDDIFLYYFLIKWINDERTKVNIEKFLLSQTFKYLGYTDFSAF